MPTSVENLVEEMLSTAHHEVRWRKASERLVKLLTAEIGVYGAISEVVNQVVRNSTDDDVLWRLVALVIRVEQARANLDILPIPRACEGNYKRAMHQLLSKSQLRLPQMLKGEHLLQWIVLALYYEEMPIRAAALSEYTERELGEFFWRDQGKPSGSASSN